VKRLVTSLLAGVAISGLLLFAALSSTFVSTAKQASQQVVLNSSPISSCSVLPQVSANPRGLSTEQMSNAHTIIGVGKQLSVPPLGWTIALMAAMQESTLRNIPYGDRDSVGLFQQRNAWGSFQQRMHPPTSAKMFYTGGMAGQPGLLDISGWQQMPTWRAAQSVQRSAFPFAYAKHEGLATSLVKTLAGADPGACNVALTKGAWALPTIGSYRLTSRFGSRIHPVRGTLDFHTGLDFAVPHSSPVYAATNGVVTSTGWGGGYGNLIKIQHADNVQTWYAHLSTIAVQTNQQVKAGAQIGAVGSTGNSTGPHLHFEVRVNGTPRDPEPWLPAHGVRLAMRAPGMNVERSLVAVGLHADHDRGYVSALATGTRPGRQDDVVPS
jgi:murein DD-endopeptidase MepM/ murein hydrolase activator NlpD